jgi:hypothetical protein
MHKLASDSIIEWLWITLAIFSISVAGCGQTGDTPSAPDVPRGYLPVIEIEIGDRLVGFGPFVGYYFKPQSPDDLRRLHFVCFNEKSFYTRDLPANEKIFEGDAVLTRLADVGFEIPADDRINPVIFSAAPAQWLQNRPEPKDEFVHFHSCYDATGPVLAGYWLRHRGTAEFTYDMGRRVGPDSPLYHRVISGTDKGFARIMEFDRGPD